jgi:hypothetical protein
MTDLTLNLNILKNTLGVVNNADKCLLGGMPLYQVKSLFDGLVLADVIDFDSQYGELLQVVLDTKRKDVAAKNIIYVRSILQSLIKEKQQAIFDLEAEQSKGDADAIESTCVNVSQHDNKETQLLLENIPRKIGRPSTGKALSNAERSKRARDKKKANSLLTVNTTLDKHASELASIMLEKGYVFNDIVRLAYSATPT